MVILKDGKPFLGDDNLNLGKLEYIARLGIWSEKEWADRGLELAEPFDCPAGYDVRGEPWYEKGKDGIWREFYETVTEQPTKELTPREILELKTGLTVDQIKEVLAS